MKIYRVSIFPVKHIDAARIGWCKHHLPRAIAEKSPSSTGSKYRSGHRRGGDASLPLCSPDGPYIRLSNIGTHEPRTIIGDVHANGPAAIAYLETLCGY